MPTVTAAARQRQGRNNVSGICGMVSLDGSPPGAERLARMAQAAVHRGPDGIRDHVDDRIAFAHLALNVTPESLSEEQPIRSERGDLILTADARIDNREELIGTLRRDGLVVPPGATDAELILAAYQYWSTDCARHLLGDFAFAIWDASRRQLYAARDPMAMRAFYYRLEPGQMLFATEIKQILAVPGVPAAINESMVAAYVAGTWRPLVWTFYEGIIQLEPAHALVVGQEGHRTWRYWDIDPEYRLDCASEEDYAAHLRELFKESVRCRLRSITPVGVMLSGGLDSGSIASTAAWLRRKGDRSASCGIHALCWAFREHPECDERRVSDRIVRDYDVPFSTLPADEAWPLKDHPAHGPDRDEPFIGVYQGLLERTMAAAQSEGMRLVLSGDRGDLMTGGWILSYVTLLRAREWRSLRDELAGHCRATGEPVARVLWSYLLLPIVSMARTRAVRSFFGWPVRRLRRFMRRQEPPPRYPEWVKPDFAGRVFLDDIIRHEEPHPPRTGFARRRRYQLVFSPLHMRAMVWSERTQARFALGFADPWSDRRIAQFVLAAPQQVLNRPETLDKRLVRRAMRGIIPHEALQAARKTPPTPFFRDALRNKARSVVLDLLTDMRACSLGYVDEVKLRGHYDSFRAGGSYHPCFWQALTLEMWLRRYWP